MKLKLFSIRTITRSVVLLMIICVNIFMKTKIEYFAIILYSLLIIILTAIEGISTERKYRNLFVFLNLAIAIIGVFFKIELSLGLAIIFVNEILIKYNYGSFLSGVLFIISMFFIDKKYILVYFLLMILAMVFYKVCSIYIEKIEDLIIENDKNRKKMIKDRVLIRDYEDRAFQRERLVRLEERNEIGRKMHDNIGHVIAGSLMRLEAVKIIMDMDKDKGIDMLDEVILNLRNGMNKSREIIHSITPKKEEIGINKIKTLLIEKFSGSAIKIKVQSNGDISYINFKLWSLIEEAVIELSTNAIKYSNCTEISFLIEDFNKFVKIEFWDNGEKIKKVKFGYGLTKISEEFEKINGKVIVDTQDGFRVNILIEKDDINGEN